MRSLAQHFQEAVRITERIKQAIKMRKIGGPIMDSRTITRDESEDGS